MTEPTIAVVPEGDASPLVRLLTRTIRASLEQDPERGTAPLDLGSVVVTSADDAQVATVTVTDDGIQVASGADPAARAVLTVDIAHRLEVVGTDADGHDALVSLVSGLLRPLLPAWQDAAQAFWASTGSDVGMPRTLVVQNAEDERDALVLGDGLPRYVVHGPADRLAGLFSGADSFLDEVFAGHLKVRGTLPQLSVMAGASFKVRFHV
ncbi:MAG: hypothetical protein JWP56_3171 [Aeromicrobium sp.]|jgi:hypothetical protein|nr:hypothetical protein [Aeromicrobium sp.]